MYPCLVVLATCAIAHVATNAGMRRSCHHHSAAGMARSGSQFTLDYEDHLLVQLIHSTIEDVRIKEGLSYDSVLGVLERRIDPTVNGRVSARSGHWDWMRLRPRKGKVIIW